MNFTFWLTILTSFFLFFCFFSSFQLSILTRNCSGKLFSKCKIHVKSMYFLFWHEEKNALAPSKFYFYLTIMKPVVEWNTTAFSYNKNEEERWLQCPGLIILTLYIEASRCGYFAGNTLYLFCLCLWLVILRRPCVYCTSCVYHLNGAWKQLRQYVRTVNVPLWIKDLHSEWKLHYLRPKVNY